MYIFRDCVYMISPYKDFYTRREHDPQEMEQTVIILSGQKVSSINWHARDHGTMLGGRDFLCLGEHCDRVIVLELLCLIVLHKNCHNDIFGVTYSFRTLIPFLSKGEVWMVFHQKRIILHMSCNRSDTVLHG